MKKLLSIAAIAALVLTGCSKDLKVTPADKLTVEYGDKLDNSKLFNAKESDEDTKVDKVTGFDTKKLGDQTLKVTFTDGNKSTEKEIKITVKDTKKPEITLKKDKITITAGDKLDLKDNVKEVKDPVDGKLKYSDKEVKKSGYHIDKEKLDTKTAGTYEVKILAYDASGNAAEKSFKVIVKKKPEKKATTTPSEKNTEEGAPATSPSSSSGQGYTSNGNSSPSSSSNGSNGQIPSTPQPQELCPGGWYPEKACDVVVSQASVGSDGKVYDTHDEAWDAGMALGEAGKIPGFDCATIDYNDRSQKWILIYHQ